MEELVFWSDQIAYGVTQKFPDRDVYTCASGISPSGLVHAGNFREIITTDFVVKSLERLGEDVRFIYSWDDYDRFRKVPDNVPEEWEQYIGLPLTEVPDPEGCHDSYAGHFEAKLEQELEPLGMDIEFIRQSKLFRSCTYTDGIRTAMQHRDEIRDILDQYRSEPLEDDWWPLRVYCRECGKDRTRITDYDGDTRVEYHCRECDADRKVDFSKQDSVKPSWRIDWPMRWAYEDVAFEPGGKDHSAAGSSRDTGVEIVEQVYDADAPVYQMYDFISLKGMDGKMSSSSGDVATISDLLEVYTPELVRFLFSGTKPNKEFSIPFDENVIQRYSRFDQIEQAYFDPESADTDNEKKLAHWRRVYELAMVEVPDQQPVRAPFDHLALLAQTRPRDEWDDRVVDSLRKTGHIEGELGEDQLEGLLERMERARNWARDHAPEKYRYAVNDEVPEEVRADLEDEAVDVLLRVADVLREESFEDSQELDDRLFAIKDDSELATGAFFTAAYRALLDREQGPRLSRFIMGLGEDRVAEVLETLR